MAAEITLKAKSSETNGRRSPLAQAPEGAGGDIETRLEGEWTIGF